MYQGPTVGGLLCCVVAGRQRRSARQASLLRLGGSAGHCRATRSGPLKRGLNSDNVKKKAVN